MNRPVAPIVFGASECRQYAGFDSRRTMQYWRSEARGADRFPEPSQRLNGGTVEVWDPMAVQQWVERTRERRGLVWTREGLVKKAEQE